MTDTKKVEETISGFLNANHFSPVSLKEVLNQKNFSKQNEYFKYSLIEVIEKKLISIKRFDQLTDLEFDNDQQLQDFLMCTYNYIFEEGSLESILESLKHAGFFRAP